MTSLSDSPAPPAVVAPVIDRRMVAIINTHRLVAPTSDETLFCFKVWKRRVDLQMGLKAAAKASGCSVATVSRVENGSMPDLDTFVRLCRWVGVSLEEGVEALRLEKYSGLSSSELMVAAESEVRK